MQINCPGLKGSSLKKNQMARGSFGNSSLIPTNTTFKNADPREFSTANIAISTTFIIIIMIQSFLGNMLVLLAFKRFRYIRTVTNFFVASLAVTDLLVAVLAMPFWVFHLTIGSVANIIVRIWTVTDILVSVSSIWHLSFVSIDRFLCISTPFQYPLLMTSRRAVVIICGIWIYSVIVAVSSQVLWAWHAFPLFVSIMNFILPSVIIMIMYFNIFRIARCQAKQIEMTINGKTRRFSLSTELKAAKVLGVVIGAFLACWSLFFALNLKYYFCRCATSLLVVSMAKWLHYGNSMVNPMLYGLLNKDFKTAFKKIILPHWRKIARGERDTSDKSYANPAPMELEATKTCLNNK